MVLVNNHGVLQRIILILLLFLKVKNCLIGWVQMDISPME
nr:MAG TPA: hypothetical protein [Caudoviricetes sp.]